MMETRDLGVSAAEILNRDKGRCLSGSTYGVGGDPIEIADRDRPWNGHAWIAEHRVIERLHVTTKGSHRHDRQDRKSTRRTPVTNAHLVCRLPPEKKKTHTYKLENHNIRNIQNQN